MKKTLILMTMCAAALLWAGPGDDGHDHGPTAAPASASVLDVELNLTVTDSRGQPVTGIGDGITVTIQKDKLTAHAGEEPGTYHVDRAFDEPGDFTADWTVVANNDAVASSFPVIVRRQLPPHEHGTSPWLYVLGGLAGLGLAFFVGRSTARARPIGAAVLVALLLTATLPYSAASGEEDGHSHGEESAVNPSSDLRIGIGQVGTMSATRKAGDYTLTMTVRVVPPDPNLVRMTEEQRELLGVQVETIQRAAFGKGLTATGVVQADPSKVASLSSPASGRVESVSATLAQIVRKGQVLAVIHAPEAASAQAEVASARAMLFQAQANRQRALQAVQLAEQNLRRREEFARAGAYSQPSFAAAKQNFEQAERELKDAKAEHAKAYAKHETHDREFRRIEQLYANKLASKRQLEEAELEHQVDEQVLNQAHARVEVAEYEHGLAKERLSREEKIAAAGLYTRQEIEVAASELGRAKGEVRAAETEIRGAQAMVAAAQARVGAYGAQGGRISIVSPIAGTLVRRSVAEGESVESGRLLFEVLDTSALWVHLEVFESDIRRVRVGMPVEIVADSQPDRMLKGTVDSIGKVVDSDRRTTQVRIKVMNPDGAVRTNEFAKALIITDIEGESISVPVSAIQEISGAKVVFIDMGGGFRRVVVTLGTTAGKRAEVLSGLEPGDRVVTQGAYQLRMMSGAP